MYLLFPLDILLPGAIGIEQFITGLRHRRRRLWAEGLLLAVPPILFLATVVALAAMRIH